jgi:hypothetical protein
MVRSVLCHNYTRSHTSLDFLKNGTPIQTYDEIEAAHKASLRAFARTGSVQPDSRSTTPKPNEDVLMTAVTPIKTPTAIPAFTQTGSAEPSPRSGTPKPDDDVPMTTDTSPQTPTPTRHPLFMPSDDDVILSSPNAASAAAPPPYAKAAPPNHVSIINPVARKPSLSVDTPRTPRRSSYTPTISSPLRSTFTFPNPLAHRKAYEHGSPSVLDSAIGRNSGVLDVEDVFGTPTSFTTNAEDSNPRLGVRLDLGDAHAAGELLTVSNDGTTATVAGPSARTITISADRTHVSATYVRNGVAHLAVARSPMAPHPRPVRPLPPPIDVGNDAPAGTPEPEVATTNGPTPSPPEDTESHSLSASKRKRSAGSADAPSVGPSPASALRTPTKTYSRKAAAASSPGRPLADADSHSAKRIRLGQSPIATATAPVDVPSPAPTATAPAPTATAPVDVPSPAPTADTPLDVSSPTRTADAPLDVPPPSRTAGKRQARVGRSTSRVVTKPPVPHAPAPTPSLVLPEPVSKEVLEDLGITEATLLKTVFGPEKTKVYSILPRMGASFARLLGHLVHIDHHKRVREAGARSRVIFKDNRAPEHDAFIKSGRLLQTSVFRDFNEANFVERFIKYWGGICIAAKVCVTDKSSSVAELGLPKRGADFSDLLWKGKNGFGTVVAALAIGPLALMRTPSPGNSKASLTFDRELAPEQFHKWEVAVRHVERVAAAMVASLD